MKYQFKLTLNIWGITFLIEKLTYYQQEDGKYLSNYTLFKYYVFNYPTLERINNYLRKRSWVKAAKRLRNEDKG